MATTESQILAVTGNEAVAEAMGQIDPDVVCAYPITPQTEVVQLFAQLVADGKVATEFVTVESEHSAMSAVIGSAAGGARTMTATSSQGFALMWEVLFVAASYRLPVVMTTVNRALSGPINIHCDHSDTMGGRDTGWIQLYGENHQEAYDNCIQGVRIAEHMDVRLPVMHMYDGYVISGAIGPLQMLTKEQVQAFIGPYHAVNPMLDADNPVTVGLSTWSAGAGDGAPFMHRYCIASHAERESTGMYAPPVERLITELSKLPGIGPRTAQRLTFHLLRQRPDEVLPLAAAIVEVKEKIGFCSRCFNLAEGDLCTICADPRRDPQLLCVVEQPFDVVTIERTREYHGYYHVLGGALSPIDGVDPEDLHLAELLTRVDDDVREVIVATNPTMTGEATAMYVGDLLPERVRVTRLASGLPVGGDLEYADELTLGRALAGRRDVRHGEE